MSRNCARAHGGEPRPRAAYSWGREWIACRCHQETWAADRRTRPSPPARCPEFKSGHRATFLTLPYSMRVLAQLGAASIGSCMHRLTSTPASTRTIAEDATGEDATREDARCPTPLRDGERDWSEQPLAIAAISTAVHHENAQAHPRHSRTRHSKSRHSTATAKDAATAKVRSGPGGENDI